MTAEDVFGIVGTTQAGNFHVERVVAEGGFGVVYRAQHGGFRAPVALKCLKIPEQMTQRQREVFLEKFREEAELMFRLSASIIEVVRPLHIDELQIEGRFVPFLALEWLEGESLDAIIRRRKESGQAPMNLHKVMKLMRPIATALGKAHRFPGPGGPISIVHRDLKPENIFVITAPGGDAVKILDFGIAKAKSIASQAAGRVTGRVVSDDVNAFTPAYGAPEQWQPKRFGEAGPWTDVWGLALTMIEALAGEPPIDGEPLVMRGIILDETRRPTPRQLGVMIAPEVDAVFEKALAVDPRERYKDVERFFGDLERAMGIAPARQRDARREPSDHDIVAGAGTEIELSPVPVSRRSVPPVSTPKPASGAHALELDLAPPPPSKREPSLGAAPSDRRPPSGAFKMDSELPPALKEDAPPPPLAAEIDVAVPARARQSGSHKLGVGAPLADAPPPAREAGASSSSGTWQVATSKTSGSWKAPVVPLAPPVPLRGEEDRPRGELGRLGARLRGPLVLVGIAVAISILDLIVTHATGQILTVGPMRPYWIAGPLALVGVVLVVFRLLGDKDD